MRAALFKVREACIRDGYEYPLRRVMRVARIATTSLDCRLPFADQARADRFIYRMLAASRANSNTPSSLA